MCLASHRTPKSTFLQDSDKNVYIVTSKPEDPSAVPWNKLENLKMGKSIKIAVHPEKLKDSLGTDLPW